MSASEFDCAGRGADGDQRNADASSDVHFEPQRQHHNYAYGDLNSTKCVVPAADQLRNASDEEQRAPR